MSDLSAKVRRCAETMPDVPTVLALGDKDYVRLKELIVCHHVTPVAVAWKRLKEQTGDSRD